MEQAGSCPSKAEELFYFLKKLAGTNSLLDMDEVLPHFNKTSSNLVGFYIQLKKLEENGALERMYDVTGRKRISHVKLLQEEISLPRGKCGVKKSVETKPEASPRVVVFIDENQLIMSELEGRKFSLDLVLEKVRQGISGEIERVFIYCSEATEKKHLLMAQNLFRPDSPLVRFVKTGSQPGVVDRRIREDIELWSRIDFVSTIVLGTADGGPDFLAAIAKVKESGKKFVLLKAGGCFNATLRQLADALIDGATPNPRRRSFEEIVVAAKDGDFYSGDLNSRFILAVVIGLKNFFKSGKDAKLVEIVQYIRTIIRARKEFDGYTEQDLREALSVLMRMGPLLIWRTESGNRVFRLFHKCTLLDVLAEFAPASSQV